MRKTTVSDVVSNKMHGKHFCSKLEKEQFQRGNWDEILSQVEFEYVSSKSTTVKSRVETRLD